MGPGRWVALLRWTSLGLPLLCQGMFEPYLKSFYIRSTDPTQIKILKVSDGRKCTWPVFTPTDPPKYPPWPPWCLPISGAQRRATAAWSLCSGNQADRWGAGQRELLLGTYEVTLSP